VFRIVLAGPSLAVLWVALRGKSLRFAAVFGVDDKGF